MHVLIEVSRILEGAGAHHVAWSLKFGFPRRDLLTEKTQRGITLDILNEIMRFKRKFVLESTKIGGGV